MFAKVKSACWMARTIAAILPFLLGVLSANAEACMSAPQWILLADLAANASADAVFRGVVTNVSTPVEPKYPSSRVAHLKVLLAVKGDLGTDIDVAYEQANGANCGTTIKVGDNVWMRTKKLAAGGWAIIGAEGDAAPVVYLGAVENGLLRIVEKNPEPKAYPRSKQVGDFQTIIRESSTVSHFTIPSLDPAGPSIDPACLSQLLSQTADQYRWWRMSVDQRGKITRVRSFYSMNPAIEESATRSALKILEKSRFRPGRINDVPIEMEIVIADLNYTCSRYK